MIADLKPYAEYKESGLPWLGQVPGHWEVKRLKNWVSINSRTLSEETPRQFEFDYLDIGSVTMGRLAARPSRQFFGSAPSRARRVLKPGDTIVSTVRTYLKAVVTVGRFDLPLVASTGFAVLTPRSDTTARCLGYVAESEAFTNQMTGESFGIAYPSISETRLGNIAVTLPPPAEQAAIVRFLDWATNRLDRAIRAKRKVIALLNEQKQAIIDRAVTRGLDSSVALKYSGVPWLGEIPKHWEVRRLKSVLARNDGGVWGSDFTPDGTIVLRSTEQAMDGTWQIHDPAVIRLSDGQVKSSLLEVGDIVVTKSSGSPSHIGKSSLVTREIADMRCCYSNFMQRLRAAHELAPEYLNLFLNSKTGRMHYQYSSTSTTGLGNLTRDTIATLPILVPDRSEQARVVDGVRQRLEPINEAISRLEREITLLREYRTRLVADVVTGKLDVHEAAARLPDEAPLVDATASPDPDDALDTDDRTAAEADA